MPTHGRGTSMDQKIFGTGLSTEVISLYLLCCGLADADSPISTKNLAAVWNGSTQALHEGLAVLETANILEMMLSDGGDSSVYRLNDARKWKKANPSPAVSE